VSCHTKAKLRVANILSYIFCPPLSWGETFFVYPVKLASDAQTCFRTFFVYLGEHALNQEPYPQKAVQDVSQATTSACRKPPKKTSWAPRTNILLEDMVAEDVLKRPHQTGPTDHPRISKTPLPPPPLRSSHHPQGHARHLRRPEASHLAGTPPAGLLGRELSSRTLLTREEWIYNHRRRSGPVVVGDEERPRDVAAEVGDASVAHEGAT
jgi:hypothetical protein